MADRADALLDCCDGCGGPLPDDPIVGTSPLLAFCSVACLALYYDSLAFADDADDGDDECDGDDE